MRLTQIGQHRINLDEVRRYATQAPRGLNIVLRDVEALHQIFGTMEERDAALAVLDKHFLAPVVGTRPWKTRLNEKVSLAEVMRYVETFNCSEYDFHSAVIFSDGSGYVQLGNGLEKQSFSSGEELAERVLKNQHTKSNE